MKPRLNLALILPLAAGAVSGIALLVLGAHAYGRRQERRAYPKAVTAP